jgi:thiamine biosynthesis protein ThiI
MPMSLFLIRYGELGLKSPNVKKRFQNALKKNIEDAFLKEKTQCITSMDWGRIYIHTDDDELAKGILKRTFGITSVSKVIETTSELEEICKIAAEYSKGIIPPKSTFAVRTKRTGSHPYTSQDIAKEVGSAVLTANKDKNVKVNLSNPDFEIFVEARHNRAFIFKEKIRGPGGFPIGTQGKVLAVISDKKSCYAAWLMMKRGCRTKLFCFGKNALDLAKSLAPWQLNFVPIMEAQDYNIDRALYLAKKVKAEALVLGDTFEEFQKREDIKAEIPVFYPLIGMSDNDIEKSITFLFGDDS